LPDCIALSSVFAYFTNADVYTTDLDSQRKLSIDAVRSLGVLLGRHFAVLLPIMLLDMNS
jgi:hypothetical protein